MVPLNAHIAANVYLEFEEDEGYWSTTPYWCGEPMKDFYPDTSYCRALYMFDIGSRRYLMKIDRSPAFLQCPDELELWGSLEKRHKRYFVPIMHGNDGRDGSPPYVISPWVPNLTTRGMGYDCPNELAEHGELVDDLAEHYNRRDLTFNKNWYLHNGRPLIVDYGCKLRG